MPKRASITDVAAAASVSITTVSHALNGKGRLNAATRERVRRVAEELGYEPNPRAQALVTGKSRLLAIQASGFESRALVPQVAYFVDLLNAASATAFQHGYGLILVPPGYSGSAVRRLAVDGAAIVDPVGDEPLLQALRSRGTPLVSTGRVPSSDGVAWVDSDHVGNTFTMLDHLAAAGVRRPALLSTDEGPSYVADVGKGYRSWCAEHGIVPQVATVRGRPTDAAAAEEVERMLAGEDPPDGVYATLDTLAIGALRAVDARGLRVPGDVAIAALTDAAVLRAANPSVTAMDLQPEQIGARAIDLLVALVEEREVDDHAIVDAKLLERTSTTGKPRVAAPSRPA